METTLPIDIAALPPALSARLLAYCEDFCAREDERHLWLAAHAAFPVVLTTDLLYKIWLNFRFDEQGQPLHLPMVAVSDLLLSTLCRPTSRQVYEMPQDIRTALLLYLKAQPRFGAARVQRLAHFLKFYLRENPRKLPSPAFAKAQEFTWLAQLDPQKAAEQLLDAWNRQKDKGRLRQMLAWSEQQAQLLGGEEGQSGHNPLSVAIQILRGIQHFQEGQRDKALQELQALKGRARKEQGEEGDGIRMDIPQAVLERLPGEFFGDQKTDAEKEKGLKKHAKIHLLFHHSLDKRKLLRQLFGRQSEKEEPLYCFHWNSNLQDTRLLSQITYHIWAWDSGLPPELDRFMLTPGGYYFLVLPPEDADPDKSKTIPSLLYRIRSQLGRQDVWVIVPQKEKEEEKQQPVRIPENDIEGFLSLKPTADFDSVLLQMLEQKAVWDQYVELDESSPLNAEWREKANLAGRERYEAGRVPFYPGFDSSSPQTDASRMVEFIKNARKQQGRLTGKELEEAQEHSTILNLLEKMGLRCSPPQGDGWFPGLLAHTQWRRLTPGLPATYIYYTFDFLPQDLMLRLYSRLIRAGAIMDDEDPLLLYLYGVPVEMRVPESSLRLEVKVAHVIEKHKFSNSSLFVSAVEALGDLMSDEQQLYYGYDKGQLAFEILASQEEATPGQEASQLHRDYRDWQEVCRLAANTKDEPGLIQYQITAQKITSSTFALLIKEKAKEFSLSPDNLAGLVSQAVERCISPETQPGGIVHSYPYPLSFQSKALHIPAHATPDMVPVEGGTFQMGSDEYDSEKPIHEVRLHSFEIGRYPVTMLEYDAFCEAAGREKVSDSGWGRGTRPAIYVDWYDAIEYCNWLSGIWGLEPAYKIEKDKKDPNNQSSGDKKKWLVTPNRKANGYRLPSEAEWEYAARGGRQSKGYRYAGSDELDEVGWYSKNSGSKTHPVGLKKPNELGLYDMSGNVWEWCWDWYDEKYYQNFARRPAENPQGPEGGEYRLVRGGSWIDYEDSRVAIRYWGFPAVGGSHLGFRLARTVSL